MSGVLAGFIDFFPFFVIYSNKFLIYYRVPILLHIQLYFQSDCDWTGNIIIGYI